MRFTVQFFLSLQDRIGELKQELETERQAHAAAMEKSSAENASKRKAEITRLREEMAIQLQEDEVGPEISALRTLIDSEKTR
jgi:hypothetical protein